jgi:hypothetical protein
LSDSQDVTRKNNDAAPVLSVMAASYVSAPISTRIPGLRGWRATAIREARVVAAVAVLALLAFGGLATAVLLPHSAAAPSTHFLTPVVTDPLPHREGLDSGR